MNSINMINTLRASFLGKISEQITDEQEKNIAYEIDYIERTVPDPLERLHLVRQLCKNLEQEIPFNENQQ